jgi:hypothetical protein
MLSHRSCVTSVKKRDDLYARIGEEIDALLAPNARVQPDSQPSPAQEAAFAAASPIDWGRPAAREKLASSIAAPARSVTPHSKWRSIFRGLLALICGLGPAVGSVEGMIEEGLLHRSEAAAAFLLLCPVWAVVIWFFLFFVRRKIKALRQAAWPLKPWR